MSDLLTQNYRDYMSLHYKARKAKEGKAPILSNIHLVAQKMSDFEKEHAEWVNSLYVKKINILEIKRQIKFLASYLKDSKLHLKKCSRDGHYKPFQQPEEIESCKPSTSNNRFWSKVDRYIMLCMLRASMHGKLHINTSTNRYQYETVKELAKEFCNER